ncbi:creatininase family protein [Notoacmeibacter sp. MSK16QG-6]|uniref:creatininase family protein n=1 Tax=Notoacmeibacter sp. MSK16QG-6 TaxID=2957982 RepID=UPI00209D9EA6|nr:creatininase family protein [Notoacmeibacter sp. MSK16QG-6]MCP1200320.1 creatininase family protein [Notoacmeibacter sp. MSK16QG-6]
MTEASQRSTDAGTIAVLPLGATEQHGPHLPPETDTLIATAMAKALKDTAPDLPLEILPVEPVGYSPEHLDWPVTQSLGWDEAIRRWIGIGNDLATRDIRRLLLLNAHGGNSPLLTIVATELRWRHKMLCVATNWHRFIQPGEIVSAKERALGIHAGQIETSVMLAIAPDRVAMNKVQDFPNAQAGFAKRFAHLRAYGPHAFGWMMSDLNPDGATGDAASATAEVGRQLIDQAGRGLAELARDMSEFDLARFSTPAL